MYIYEITLVRIHKLHTFLVVVVVVVVDDDDDVVVVCVTKRA